MNIPYTFHIYTPPNKQVFIYMMEPVSDKPVKKSKEQLLQERRAKLAKWKLKKSPNQHQQTNIEDTSVSIEKHVTNTGNRASPQAISKDEKALLRQKKLEEWKRKKRERDESKKTEEVKTEGTKIIKKLKKNKVKKKRITFDESEDSSIINSSTVNLKLFDPTLVETDEASTDNLQDLKQDDRDSDPFEDLMNELHTSDNQESNIVVNTLDVIDEYDDMLDGSTDLQKSDDEQETRNKMKRIARMRKLKTVNSQNYDISTLEPIQKSFYQEPEELKRLTPEEIEELRLGLDNIKIKGNGCPCPILRWSQLGLNTATMNLINNVFQFKTVTPIQAQTIPAIMSGRDVIGISKTGSGKTIAYFLPLIRHIKAQRELSRNETGPIGLILAPTRELALQINEEVLKFAKYDDKLTSICCTGGSEMKKQINDLKRGVKIVVATPGRFIDLLTLNNGKLLNMKRVSFVILDEADRLFDMGFEPQITQIMRAIRPDKQLILFSATFPNKLKKFAIRVLNNPLSITINAVNMVNENIEQTFRICKSEPEKFDSLLMTLENHAIDINESSTEPIDRKAIIFVASQQTCDALYSKLEKYDYDSFAIHAGKSYQERVMNLNEFKNTPNSILICTEVLSRGLNVPEVSLVIIYNGIKTFAEYVHTTGRTARGTNRGRSLTLLLTDEINAAYIIKRAIRDKDLANHDSGQISALNEMSEQFEVGLKNGKYKLLKGFGGKGLENIETQRNEIKDKEISTYLLNGDESISDKLVSRKESNNGSTDIDSSDVEIPKLEYITEEKKETDGSTSYIAKVNVNDLPQLVRWEATKNSTFAFIKNETGCSITTRGKYYPPDKPYNEGKDEPKLYLLIETNEEKNIRLCMELLEDKVKEGINKVEQHALKNSKF